MKKLYPSGQAMPTRTGPSEPTRSSHDTSHERMTIKKERPVAASDGKVAGRVNKTLSTSMDHTSSSSTLFLLSTIFVSVFICFSGAAKAQSRQDVGTAEAVKPLQIGDTIPEELWHLPLQVVNHPDGKDTITLNDYRDKKLIILDFWATWCAPCIRSVKHIDSLLSVFNDELVCLLPVNRYDNAELMHAFIEKGNWTFPSVINNTILDERLLSGYREYLGVIWIMDNKLFAVPKNISLTHQNILFALTGQSKNVHISNYLPRHN